MSYRFLPQAERDLHDAVDYYETCQLGLGTEFLIEIRQTIGSSNIFMVALQLLFFDGINRIYRILLNNPVRSQPNHCYFL